MEYLTEADRRARAKARVEEVARGHITAGTRKTYLPNQRKFIRYLLTYYRDEIGMETSQPLSDEEKAREVDSVLLPISADNAVLVRVLESLTEEVVSSFYMTLIDSRAGPASNNSAAEVKKSMGTAPKTARSAVYNLFTDTSVRLPEFMSGTLIKNLFQAYRRSVARAKGEEGAEESGKCAFTYEIYTLLCKAFVFGTPNSSPSPSALAFHTLSWSFFCRSENTRLLTLNHLSWCKDALIVKFSHAKNDQEGDMGCENPKHVYSNPTNPPGCPILALAVHLVCLPRSKERHVFLGSANMANGQRAALMSACEGVRSSLAALGYEPSDFGTHSNRKGSTTHCASDIEDGPPLMSVFLRGGWRIAGPKEVYVKYAARGDQAVGRCASGLSMTSAEEAVQVAPYFVSYNDCTERALLTCYPWCLSFSSRLRPVLLSCLASLVYHHAWMVVHLPSVHPYRRSAFFQDSRMVESLDSLVKGGNRNTLAQNIEQATGVSTHVRILAKLKMIEREGGNNLFERLKNYLELEGFKAPHVTQTSLREALEQQRSTFEAFISEQMQAVLESRPCTDAEQSADPMVGSTSGRWWENRVPQDYKLPSANLDESWRMWWHGLPADKIPAIRTLRPQDFRDVRQRDALTAWRRVMCLLEDCCRMEGMKPKPSSPANELQGCIETLVERRVLPPAILKRKGRTLRPRERTILTIHKIVKKRHADKPREESRPFANLFG